MSSPLKVMRNALNWLYNQTKTILFPTVKMIPTGNQILLGSTVGIAGIIATDLVFGYKSFLVGNAMTERRIIPQIPLPLTRNLHSTITKTNSNTPPLTLTQSSTMITKSSFVVAESKPLKPVFLRNKLSFRDWLFQYFYQTRLNLYTNVIFNCIDVYFINYSRRHDPDLTKVGTILIVPSFHTMIDPPNLKRHKYVLNKLGVQKNDNIIFFSDVNFWIPYHEDKQLIEFIEICCEITNDNQCVALFWRVKGTKLGYAEMGDGSNMSTEQLLVILVFWACLKVHALCHAYGEKIILKTPTNMNDEMEKIHQDFKTAETSMLALNHVVRYSSFVCSKNSDDFQRIVDLNCLNMVWKHGSILQQKLLSNMRITNFLTKARKKLLRMFTINKLYGIYDFEAAFLCIVCHSIDHLAFKDITHTHFKSDNMGIPDMLPFVTIFGKQSKPILRESRLKYLANSKMLKQFSNYLESIDSELSNCVHLIASG